MRDSAFIPSLKEGVFSLRLRAPRDKGKPYVLPENCVIRLPAIYKNRQLRIFVENEEDVDGNYTDVSTEEISD